MLTFTTPIQLSDISFNLTAAHDVWVFDRSTEIVEWTLPHAGAMRLRNSNYLLSK
jgi:hypothetical protein